MKKSLLLSRWKKSSSIPKKNLKKYIYFSEYTHEWLKNFGIMLRYDKEYKEYPYHFTTTDNYAFKQVFNYDTNEFIDVTEYSLKYNCMTDFILANEEVREFRQCWTGLTRNFRQLLILDFDENYDLPEVQEKNRERLDKCKAMGFPSPRYININRRYNPYKSKDDQNHYQWVYELSDPFNFSDINVGEFEKNEHRNFLWKLQDFFGADTWNNGDECKVPFGKDMETLILNDNLVSRNDLYNPFYGMSYDVCLNWYLKNNKDYNAIPFRIPVPFLEEFKSREDAINHYTDRYLPPKALFDLPLERDKLKTLSYNEYKETFGKRKKKSYKKENRTCVGLASVSRNCYATHNFTNAIWKLIDSYKGDISAITEKSAINVFKELEYESLQYNGKKEIEDDYLIRQSVKSLLPKVLNSYVPRDCFTDSPFSKEQRANSRLEPKMKASVLAWTCQKLMKTSLKRSDIKKAFYAYAFETFGIVSISHTTYTKYRSMDVLKMKKDISDYINFFSETKTRQNLLNLAISVLDEINDFLREQGTSEEKQITDEYVKEILSRKDLGLELYQLKIEDYVLYRQVVKAKHRIRGKPKILVA